MQKIVARKQWNGLNPPTSLPRFPKTLKSAINSKQLPKGALFGFQAIEILCCVGAYITPCVIDDFADNLLFWIFQGIHA